jgi:hypothetical protein
MVMAHGGGVQGDFEDSTGEMNHCPLCLPRTAYILTWCMFSNGKNVFELKFLMLT